MLGYVVIADLIDDEPNYTGERLKFGKEQIVLRNENTNQSSILITFLNKYNI